MTTGPPMGRHSWLASDRPVPRLIARPVRTFLDTEAAGGIVLLLAAVLALAWANSPFGDSYTELWGTHLGIEVGSFSIDLDLRHWVNEALMAIFFFVVGLEIKRELVAGELNSWRRAALPALAAVGGMVVPAAVYLLINAGGAGASGWGIPMATDIAFAVGVLALLSDRVPAGLKVFLLSLAIVDDIGAILVIAIFYSAGIEPEWLLAAGALLALIIVLRRVNVFWVPIYVALGAAVWLATFQSGVHATIAGVALGLLTPARPTDPGGFPDVLEHAKQLSSEPDAQSLRGVTYQAHEVVSVAERLEHVLHPWSSFLIIPLFALANAGVALSPSSFGDAIASPVALGIIFGLVAGKIIGISLMSWIAIKLRLGEAPPGMRWSQLIGTAAVAGIGFTVSLFIAALAFDDPELVDAAKMGVLVASFTAGLIGATILLLGPRSGRESES